MGMIPQYFAKVTIMNIFTAIGQTLNSCVSVLTAAARTTEKTVILVENEVDLLHVGQSIRITSVKSELTSLIHRLPLEQS